MTYHQITTCSPLIMRNHWTVPYLRHVIHLPTTTTGMFLSIAGFISTSFDLFVDFIFTWHFQRIQLYYRTLQVIISIIQLSNITSLCTTVLNLRIDKRLAIVTNHNRRNALPSKKSLKWTSEVVCT